MPTRTRYRNAIQTLIERVGASYLAERLGQENVSTVSSWKSRSSIPIVYWPMLIAAAQEKGITLDEATLVRIHLAPADAEAVAKQAASHAV